MLRRNAVLQKGLCYLLRAEKPGIRNLPAGIGFGKGVFRQQGTRVNGGVDIQLHNAAQSAPVIPSDGFRVGGKRQGGIQHGVFSAGHISLHGTEGIAFCQQIHSRLAKGSVVRHKAVGLPVLPNQAVYRQRTRVACILQHSGADGDALHHRGAQLVQLAAEQRTQQHGAQKRPKLLCHDRAPLQDIAQAYTAFQPVPAGAIHQKRKNGIHNIRCVAHGTEMLPAQL